MKRLILITALLISPQAYADLFSGEYVSPETYAVNEADLQDYKYFPSAPKVDIDHLDEMHFDNPNVIEKDFQIGQESNETSEKITDKKTKKDKKVQKENSGDIEPYKKKLSYKIAKWWVDQRYKREEPHHGSLHEIKTDKRIQNEQNK